MKSALLLLSSLHLCLACDDISKYYNDKGYTTECKNLVSNLDKGFQQQFGDYIHIRNEYLKMAYTINDLRPGKDNREAIEYQTWGKLHFAEQASHMQDLAQGLPNPDEKSIMQNT